jgi:hypothetical protein
VPAATDAQPAFGRTLVATAGSVDDLLWAIQVRQGTGDAAASGGGLRGGWFRSRVVAGEVEARMRDYAYVPGVTVTGSLRFTARGPVGRAASGAMRPPPASCGSTVPDTSPVASEDAASRSDPRARGELGYAFGRSVP